MAFYARSEEARQSHATQNFALVIFILCPVSLCCLYLSSATEELNDKMWVYSIVLIFPILLTCFFFVHESCREHLHWKMHYLKDFQLRQK